MRRELALAVGLLVSVVAHGQIASPAGSTPSSSSLYIKVRLDSPVKVSALKPGDMVEGKLALGIYSGESELFPAGSSIRLKVDELGRRRRVPNDHWPWVIKVFTPRHENYPLFHSATVIRSDGSEVPLRVSLIAIGQSAEVRAPARKSGGPDASQPPKPDHTKQPPTIVTLEAEIPKPGLLTATTSGQVTPAPVAASSSSSLSPSLSADRLALSAGTPARIILLGGVSAGQSVAGDSFQARLVEPVRLGPNVVLPEGSLFEGKVMKSVRPRWLSRAGSLVLSFTSVTLPGGVATPVTASVAAAELDQRSHTRIDPEGVMRGDRPGKAWMLVNIGTTVGIGKLTDDGLQLVIEAFSSAATDASTAGAGRIAALCASTIFLITRHGRDVVLPKFTEMSITFDRPFLLPLRP